jgi:hypothetical protein
MKEKKIFRASVVRYSRAVTDPSTNRTHVALLC